MIETRVGKEVNLMVRNAQEAHSSPDRSRVRAEARQDMGRRDFIRTGSVGLVGAGLATLVGGRTASGEQTQKSPVIMVKHNGATDESGVGNPAVVKEMVKRAVAELTGKDSLRDIWKEFASPDDIVGIKINCIAKKNFSTQKCVVDAIVEGLTSAGVKPNNIIIWERWNWEMKLGGYEINTSDAGVRCYGTDHGGTKEAARSFYSDTPVDIAGVPVYFSKILLEEVTALINVPLVKDHRTSGVTCSMKNHFGSIINPGDLHRSNCDPYLAYLNLASPIKDKTRLIVCDFLRAVYNGGPGDSPDRWRQNAIMVSRDPVALDSVGLRIIEEKRKEKGMLPIGERARYVATAAKLGVGTNDPAQIDLREIDMTQSA